MTVTLNSHLSIHLTNFWKRTWLFSGWPLARVQLQSAWMPKWIQWCPLVFGEGPWPCHFPCRSFYHPGWSYCVVYPKRQACVIFRTPKSKMAANNAVMPAWLHSFSELGGSRILDLVKVTVFSHTLTRVSGSALKCAKVRKIPHDLRFIAQSAQKFIPHFTSCLPADILNGSVS